MGLRWSAAERPRVVGRVREAPDARIDGGRRGDCVAPAGSQLLPWGWERAGGIARGAGSASCRCGSRNGVRQLVVTSSSHVATQVAGERIYSTVRYDDYFFISELTNGEQETQRQWCATKHGCFHGPRASTHILVGAVAGGLPWMLGYSTSQL